MSKYLLYSAEELKEAFARFKFHLLETVTRKTKGEKTGVMVIRMVAEKPLSKDE